MGKHLPIQRYVCLQIDTYPMSGFAICRFAHEQVMNSAYLLVCQFDYVWGYGIDCCVDSGAGSNSHASGFLS